ncbi:MAG TPA: hypothetical protein VLT36_22965, partial [Candidatus Dormibacteraeota bacterium]|nr:hypothetical protein [Candidatus Dormibacteraeota bacterium]
MNRTTPAINSGLSTRLRVSPLILAIFAYAGLASFEPTVEAQSINIKQPQIRITVPLLTGITTLVTGQVSRAGIDTGGITLSVSGAPAGATAIIAPNTVTSNNTPYKITLNTTNIAQGLYTLSVNANGLDTNAVARTNFWLFQLHAGHIWNGSTNAAADGAGNWSDATKWLGGGLIGADEVIFNDLGGQTNSLLIVPNTSTNLLINTIVNNDTSIASLRFAQTNGSTGFHTLQIAAGRTLRITGTNGFSVHRDYISDSGFENLGSSLTVTVVGTNGSMVVSNKGADFAMLLDNGGNNARSTLDLSRLDNLTATVEKFALGDVGAWPNYMNVYANGSAPWPPRSFLDNVQLAKTNVIVASFVDANNYTNSDDRNYSLCYLNSLSQGSTTQPTLSLGISNAFLMDSVCFLHANQAGNVNFTSGFTNAYALFRSTNGGRMSVFTTGDGGTVNLGRSN